jgi:hypothetical protein
VRASGGMRRGSPESCAGLFCFSLFFSFFSAEAARFFSSVEAARVEGLARGERVIILAEMMTVEIIRSCKPNASGRANRSSHKTPRVNRFGHRLAAVLPLLRRDQAPHLRD